MQKEVLRLENISKSFSGNCVLKDIQFSIKEGEVRALVGENGAGKSTMIKIISSAIKADSGVIYLWQKQVNFASPKESLKAGISVMYQELDLLPDLSIVENVFLGIEMKTPMNTLDRKPMYNTVENYFQEMNLNIDPDARVGSLPIVMRQMVAAIKAMVHEAKVVIMDEPSSSLTNKELQVLFDLIRKLKQQNIAVIYVSHRLEEIFEICDSVTVLLNGEMVSTKTIQDTSKEKVIEKMLGRKVLEVRLNSRESYSAPIILEAKDISLGQLLQNVSFQVMQGEIYGILGLVGSGVTELGKILYGIKKPTTGQLIVGGKEKRFTAPTDALKSSISYVSDDRRAYGVFMEMDVEKNGTISALRKFLRYKPLLLLDQKRIRDVFVAYVEKLGIRITGNNQHIRFLSGGNQQKVLIARALINDTEIIILNSPTKGIDVGAKFEIYQILLQCAEQGKTVIVLSQEITELVQICDRILMLKQGEVYNEYAEDRLSESLIYNELLS